MNDKYLRKLTKVQLISLIKDNLKHHNRLSSAFSEIVNREKDANIKITKLQEKLKTKGAKYMDEVLFCMRVPSRTVVDSSLIEPWLDTITLELTNQAIIDAKDIDMTIKGREVNNMSEVTLITGKELDKLRKNVFKRQERKIKAEEKARAKLEPKPEDVIQRLKEELAQANWKITTLERQVKSYSRDGRAILYILTGEEVYNDH